MIECIIDGNIAYPSNADKIKITYENEYVKDSGEYSYDISFPMAITANRKVFRNVQRFEVRKKLPAFEECRLLVNNRLVISGKGTVTTITQDTVKLQIVGGKSRIKYNSNFEKHYIDELEYPPIHLDCGIAKDVYDKAGQHYPYMEDKPNIVFIDLKTASYVGQHNAVAFSPINDETNNLLANRVCLCKFEYIEIQGVRYPEGTYAIMVDMAPQPFLFYVLDNIMKSEGYTIERNDFNKDPWDRLVIVNACKTGRVKDALPHWTVYTFLDELRKLFNASIVFDDVKKTVKIIASNELLAQDMVSYDCEDDFSAEYDENGLDNLSTSNIEYSFDSSINRDWREYISQSVQKNYKTKTYNDLNELVSDAEKMTEKERRTTIFKTGYSYYIWAEMPLNGDPDSEKTEVIRTQCGYFNPLLRDETDNFQDLNICPAAIYRRKTWEKDDNIFEKFGDKIGNQWIIVPSVANDKEAGLEDMTKDEDGDYYYSVQDAMEDGDETLQSEDSEDDGKMVVAFIANNVYDLVSHKAELFGEPGASMSRTPVLYTDYRMFPNILISSTSGGSLSLESVSKDNRFQSNTTVNKYDQIAIKLVTDDIPDPSKIYLLKNKKYICEKIEMEISNDGISKEKTGYFYEILD